MHLFLIPVLLISSYSEQLVSIKKPISTKITKNFIGSNLHLSDDIITIKLADGFTIKTNLVNGKLPIITKNYDNDNNLSLQFDYDSNNYYDSKMVVSYKNDDFIQYKEIFTNDKTIKHVPLNNLPSSPKPYENNYTPLLNNNSSPLPSNNNSSPLPSNNNHTHTPLLNNNSSPLPPAPISYEDESLNKESTSKNQSYSPMNNGNRVDLLKNNFVNNKFQVENSTYSHEVIKIINCPEQRTKSLINVKFYDGYITKIYVINNIIPYITKKYEGDTIYIICDYNHVKSLNYNKSFFFRHDNLDYLPVSPSPYEGN